MRSIQSLLRGPRGVAGAGLLMALLVLAVLGICFTPYDPMVLDYSAPVAAPSRHHWLGTDQFGRDLLSRAMLAASVTTLISVATTAFALLLGTLLGAWSGHLGGWVDRGCSMLMNALLAFPGILAALALLSIIGPSPTGVVLALGFAYTPGVFRVVRAMTLSIREKEYVEAARAMGSGSLYIIARHIIPNCVSPLTVLATSLFGMALLAESALSFLGLGVQPPMPTWGAMLADGRQFMTDAPWLAIVPGMAIWLALIGVNLFGDALRDHFDPRMELP